MFSLVYNTDDSWQLIYAYLYYFEMKALGNRVQAKAAFNPFGLFCPETVPGCDLFTYY